VTTTADRTGVLRERRKAFFGEHLWCRQGFLLFAQQADFVQRHAQVGIDALFGRGEVAARVQLIAGHRLRLMGHPTPGHHGSGDRQNQQAQQQDIQGFMAGAGRAYDLRGWRTHGASISAWSISTT